MYFYSKLYKSSNNINVAIIGCGKFISMFLAQYKSLKNIVISKIVDINIEYAKANCLNASLSNNVISSINFLMIFLILLMMIKLILL